MRHEAGFASGDVVDLPPGRHQFGACPATIKAGHDAGALPIIAFEIDVHLDEAGKALSLVPHTDNASQAATLTVNGRLVSDIIAIEPGAVIGIGPDAFVLEGDQPDVASPWTGPLPNRVVVPPSPERRLPPPFAVPTALALLLAALLVVAFGDLTLWPMLAPTTLLVAVTTRRQGRLQRRYTREHAEQEARRVERFRTDLETAAGHEASRRREAVISAHQVLRAARRGRRVVSDRPIAIALGTAAWRPEVDVCGPLDAAMLDLLAEHSSLAAVPVAIDPAKALLGIVGPRPATLAVARHLLTAAAQGQAPVRFEGGLRDDAAWQLLLDLQSCEASATALGVIDGGRPTTRPNAGVVLADTEDQLAFPPDLLMRLQPNGVVTLTVPSAGLSAHGLMPIGISHARLGELASLRHEVAVQRGGTRQTYVPPSDPRQPVAGPVLMATSSVPEELAGLTTLMLDVLMMSRRTRVVVLDSEDEGLRGLRDLPHVSGYAANDHETLTLL
ncbi:MAG: hypothetical protein O3C27_15135, partial [Actinomycetota bacterium]|nr:hypothetical protein [Actinomycetota bacterium]